MWEIQHGEYIWSLYWTGGRSRTSDKVRGKVGGGFWIFSSSFLPFGLSLLPDQFHPSIMATKYICPLESCMHTPTTACKQARWIVDIEIVKKKFDVTCDIPYKYCSIAVWESALNSHCLCNNKCQIEFFTFF